MKRTFKTVAGAYSPEIAKLATAARDFLLSLFPKLQEGIDPKASYLFYSFGPGYKGLVCTLFLSKSANKAVKS